MAKQKSPELFDVAIIGAGPAALSASVYASRYKLSNLVIGPELGGYVSTTHLVEDYLGYQSVTGLDLSKDFVKHAESFGATIAAEKVTEVKRDGDAFVLKSWADKEYRARSLILATGTNHNKLGIPGEDKFEGRGVSYCVTCDAGFFKGKPVVIVGGGDSSAKGALHLSEFASEVFLVHRRKEFRSEPTWIDRLKQRKNVTFVLENEVTEVLGENNVTGAKLKQPFKGKSELRIDGFFVEIGSTPDRTLPDMLGVKVKESNYVIVNGHQRTSAELVWAAGDNTTGSALFRQIITAAAEGSVAAGDIYEYLNDSRRNWSSKDSMVTD